LYGYLDYISRPTAFRIDQKLTYSTHSQPTTTSAQAPPAVPVTATSQTRTVIRLTTPATPALDHPPTLVPTLEATSSAQVPPAVLATATSRQLVVTSSTTLAILVSVLRARLVLTRAATSTAVELPAVLDTATSRPTTTMMMRAQARRAVCFFPNPL
jgi:hypothetical protein